MCFSICSCGGEKPDGVVSAYCDAMKEYDHVKMMEYVVTDKEISEDDTDAMTNKVIDCFKPFVAQMEYTIEETVIEEDTATVTVKFDYPDIAPVMPEVIQDFFGKALALAFSGASEEETNEVFVTILGEKLTNFEAEMTSETVQFNCCKTDEGWMIAEIPEIENILSCNMNAGYEGMEIE